METIICLSIGWPLLTGLTVIWFLNDFCYTCHLNFLNGNNLYSTILICHPYFTDKEYRYNQKNMSDITGNWKAGFKQGK